MRVLETISTQEIKYGKDHTDKLMFDLETFQMTFFKMKCLGYNYYRATNFMAECFNCGRAIREFYIGKIEPSGFFSIGWIKAYTYIFKCNECFDEILEGAVNDEFYI